MPSDIDVFQPNVEPPREDATGEAPAGDDPGPEPSTDSPVVAEAVTEAIPEPGADGSDDLLTPPEVVEPTLGSGTASSDDLTASLTHVRPDPLLGAFVSEESPDASALAPGPAVALPEEEIQGHGPHPGSRADAMNALGAINLGGVVPAVGPALSGSSSDAFAAITHGHSPPASKTQQAKQKPAEEEEDDDDEDDDSPPARGSSLAMMMLASYASAVTLGLIWVLWTGRRLPESTEPDEPPADTRSDPGSRAGSAHRIVAPKPIPAEHLATLGKTVRLGQIEATPLAVTSGPVYLKRNFERHETKREGENAIKLRLRLRNASADAVIAPLDEAYLRDRPRADPDSYIETSAGSTPIGQFPLAVESEWSIVGQQFRDLKPGESFETLVVSAPDALAKKAPEMTWRIRLRTDLNHTDDLGVRFSEADLKPSP